MNKKVTSNKKTLNNTKSVSTKKVVRKNVTERKIEKKEGKNNMKNINFKDKKVELIIGIVVVVVIVFLGLFLIFKKSDDSKNNEKNNPTEDKGETFTEKNIVDAYGMTSEDAIKLVKSLFNSDNFVFSTSVSDDAKYIVTVKNTISNTEYKYEVDPVTESFYEIK